RGCLVEVLPTIQGYVPLAEVDWTYVRDVREFVREGEELRVQVLELDPRRRRLILSIKAAMGKPLREPLELIPDGKSFPPRSEEPTTEPPPELAALQEENEELAARLDASETDRRRL